jgi:uncharacterized membrane protein YhaH (DUF805 family)
MKCPQCPNDNPENAQFCGGCGANLSSGEATARLGLPTVGFSEAISRGFTNYFTFNGRASRPEYWWWVLFTFLLGLIPLAGLVTLIPTLAVTSRRLHDIGKSGWLQILPWAIFGVAVISAVAAIPIPPAVWIIAAFASFVGLIVWLVRKGDEGANKYGPDPRQPTSQQPYKP